MNDRAVMNVTALNLWEKPMRIAPALVIIDGFRRLDTFGHWI